MLRSVILKECCRIPVRIDVLIFLYTTGEGEPADFYLGDLLGQLSAVVAAKPSERVNICEGKTC